MKHKYLFLLCATLIVLTGCNVNEPSSGSKSGSGSSSGSSSSSSTYPENLYNISQTVCFKLYMLDGKNDGSWEVVTYYKWETKSSPYRVILSRGPYYESQWIGVASKNSDSKRGIYDVSKYRYKYINYTPVGGAWYYYFDPK